MKMKTNNLFLMILALALALVLASCQKETETTTTVVDFEDVTLNSDSISDGTSFKSGNSTFSIVDGAFWNGGIVCSSKKDTVTSGFLNQYSSVAGLGAYNSEKYAVVYSPGSFNCPKNTLGNYNIKSMMVTNSTYAYLDMKNGTPLVSKIFTSGDWFKMIVKGYLNKKETNSVDYYLADFRNGKSFISKNWEKISLVSLSVVDSVAITFDSSDKGSFGVNTPQYVCIDNIEFTQTVEVK